MEQEIKAYLLSFADEKTAEQTKKFFKTRKGEYAHGDRFLGIKMGKLRETLAISEALIEDEQDLMHKATGWMLREVGKMDMDTEREFLLKHYKKMPRTMLRYAIERFDENERQGFLKGNF